MASEFGTIAALQWAASGFATAGVGGTDSVMAMIASVARLKSNLTEKGATRPSAIMRKKMPSGSSDLQEMPRRREYPEGAEGEVEWCNDVDAASSSYAKANRAQSTANEHDQYAWGFNEYAKRQGFASFLERCGEGERPPRSSGTGRLKPTYDDKGAMRVAEFLPALRSSVAEAVAARSSRCATPPSPSAGARSTPCTEPLEQRAAHDVFDIPTPPQETTCATGGAHVGARARSAPAFGAERVARGSDPAATGARARSAHTPSAPSA